MDYDKSLHPNHFFYRTDKDGEHDCLCISIDGRPWEYFFRSQKDFEEWRKQNPDNHWDNPEEKNPENCSVCGKLVLSKDGWMRLWNDHCRIVGVNDDGYSLKFSKPHVLAYFHPECAEKYFADKEQWKSIIFRNLDKISFDQAGHLANAELLKNPHNEYGTQQKERAGVYRVKIEGKEINLRDFDREENWKNYLEIRDAIVKNLKQNLSDWEIKKDKYNNNYFEKRKNGVKVWEIIFCEIAFKDQNAEQDWAEIVSALKDSNLSSVNNEENSLDLELIKSLFRELGIRKITFENNKINIEYNDISENNNSLNEQIFKNFCQKNNQKEITRESLNLEEENVPTNLNQNKNNYQLAIGLAVGAIAFLLTGTVVYLLRKGKKQRKS